MRTAVPAFILLAAAAVVSAPSRAVADDTGVWKGLRGKIIVSDEALPTSAASDGAFIAALKKAHKMVIPGGGSWTLNFTIFLSKPAGVTEINIVFYDMANPKKPEQVNYASIAVQRDQKTVAVSGVTVSKELGLVPGHKYELRAARLVGDKEEVYAKATVTLK